MGGDELETFQALIGLINHLELTGFYTMGFPTLSASILIASDCLR